MEIRQLKYFVLAARTLNFTEAAQAAHVVQSTLSQQIKQLETELSVSLFHRVGRHVTLTVEGRAFLPDAERILLYAEKGRQRMADLRAVEGGDLYIGVCTGIGLSAILIDALTEFNRQHPRVHVHIEEDIVDVLEQRLLDHKIDLAMMFTPRQANDAIEVRPIFTTRLKAIVGERHPLASASSITLEQLQMHPLVLPGKSWYVRQELDGMAARQGVVLEPTIEINVNSQLLYMVQRGHWITVLPDVATLAYNGLVTLPIQGEEGQIETSILVPADRYQRRAVTLFVEALEESARQMWP